MNPMGSLSRTNTEGNVFIWETFSEFMCIAAHNPQITN